MESPVSLLVVTADRRVLARIESLTRGSHVTVLGGTASYEQAIRQAALRRPDAVVLDGQIAEEHVLAFARRLLEALPGTKCIFFGASVDVAVMARAVASGVSGYLPTTISYPDFVEAVSAIVAGRPPLRESAFTRTARALARPVGNVASGRGEAALRQTAARCLELGLTAAETARYLGIPEPQVLSRVSRPRRQGPAWAFPSNRRLLYAIVMAVAFWTMMRVSGITASDIPQTEPVRGSLCYEDGTALPLALCELTFHATATGPLPRATVGRAIVRGREGEVRSVCYGAKFQGLPPGVYKATVRLPGGVPLPEYIAAPEYGESTKTPLTVDTAQRRFVLGLRKPAALLERFDRDANGLLDGAEQVAIREAMKATQLQAEEGD